MDGAVPKSDVASLAITTYPLRLIRRPQSNETQLKDGIDGGHAKADGKKAVRDHRPFLKVRAVDIVVDDRLHADLHVHDARKNEKQHHDRRAGMRELGTHPGRIFADEP